MGIIRVRRGRLGLMVMIATLATATALGAAGPVAAGAATSGTGFSQPFAGTPRYLEWAPTQARHSRQVNRPLGARRADRIARKLGLDKRLVFTPEQYVLFITGKGVGGDPAAAKLVDESVRIFINTTGSPLVVSIDGRPTPIVLGSYGLFVNQDGLMMSLANTDAPTRQVNSVIAPGGYLGTWCRDNGCERSLRMLYRSAYTSEVVFGFASQQQSGVAQLVTNVKRGRTSIVGMSMAPSIWIVNFVLLYVLNPSVAAKMPARWTPIPDDVASAIAASPSGQVPYRDFAASFPS